MNPQLSEIRDQQKNSWNRFSGGWKKWDDLTMDFLQPMGNEIIKFLQLKGNERVLDIAAGTGEPGLTIASIVKNGHVVITDLAEDMLKVAQEKINAGGFKNVETMACDVTELPFEDNSFDAISCRFGFMFFPDMTMAAKEMARVLKPGGRMATAVWNGPEKNAWVTIMMGSIKKYVELQAPLPGAPGMFRCSPPGLMKGIFENAGFKNVEEKEILSRLNSGDAETYWQLLTEVGAPVVAALANANKDTIEKVKTEVFSQIKTRYPGQVAIDGSALIFCGQK
jgi:ubiquinone/menaquinone biosynthesis C-methylase UbiE